MRHLYYWALCAVLVAPAGFGQNLDLRMGLWEMTSSTQSSGPPPIDTSKMTPEQRERIEAAMKAVMAQAAHPKTTQTCVTKEKLDQSLLKGSTPERCMSSVVNTSRTSRELKFSCPGTMLTSADILIQALSKESVKMTGTMLMKNGRGAMTMNMNGAGKWIADACGDVK